MADPSPRFETYRDKAGDYRWRLISENGSDILADSGEGYSSRSKAKEGVSDVQREAPGAPTIDK